MKRAHVRRSFAGARARIAHGERGLALVVVLLVLLALLVLCTPFLLSARNADRASTELADRAAARIGLESAARHARARLAATHPSIDHTPYSDDLEEVTVDNRFDPAFLDANDPHASMWDLESSDVAGKIDLDSASPFVIANLLGLATRFTRAIAVDDKTLDVAATGGLEATGVVWCGGELVHYGKIDGGSLADLGRGLLAHGESNWHGGPRPASIHDAGAPVLDQRAFAPALWRAAGDGRDVRVLGSMERLSDTALFRFAPMDSAAARSAAGADERSGGEASAYLAPLARHATAHGGLRAGPRWQRAARLVAEVVGGQDGILKVDDVRWFNPGSTVRIQDGVTSEIALVSYVSRDREVTLDRVLTNDYRAYSAEVRVLARRPVNLNTAAFEVLEALFANLQIVGRNSRVTRDEAFELARLVTESRPFDGLEDFLKRVVLPAAGLEALPADAMVHPEIVSGGKGFLDPLDALAVYENGLNANDGALLFSTMPYCFTTRDVYDLELRSTVNAPSGVERVSLVREQCELVCPQRELMLLWSRQEDFEESLRFDREAPWWMTAPNATSRWGTGTVPPSRIWSHMGTVGDEPYLPALTASNALTAAPTMSNGDAPSIAHVFGSREQDAWIQLWPAREDEVGKRQGRILHFDHETRDPEGRYLPDEVVQRTAGEKLVQWTDPPKNVTLARPFSLSLWFKPKDLADGVLFDVGGASRESDRVSLLFEQPDLVLRVLDATGDHPDTAEKEAGEVRYALTAGATAGVPIDTWSHVAIDVRGTRPDQMTMLVDGLARGVRTPGLTRLTSSVAPNGTVFPVESIEGFPPSGVARVGEELIEYTITGTNLVAAPSVTGPLAGFGGRAARVPYGGPAATRAPLTTPLAHPSGASVALYGYADALQSNAPNGVGQLPRDLGRFAVGVVKKATGDGGGSINEPINLRNTLTNVGQGIEGTSQSKVRELDLETIEPSITDEELMKAFDKGGGYAVLMQYGFTALTIAGEVHDDIHTQAGTPIFGMEIVYYTGWEGTRLKIDPARRGGAGLKNTGPGIGERRAFVVEWSPNIVTNTVQSAIPFSEFSDKRVFVFPISVVVPGASNLTAFVAPLSGQSEFAQITQQGQPELTEWVRYDEIAGDYLVRDAAAGMQLAYRAATHNDYNAAGDATGLPPGPGGGGPHPHLPPPGSAHSAAPALAPPAAPPPQSAATNVVCKEYLGTPELTEGPLTKSVRESFQFRGVFGTYSHAQPAGSLVLPCFRVERTVNLDVGRPGRMDAVFATLADANDPGFPGRIHHAYRPIDFTTSGWMQAPNAPDALVDASKAGVQAFLANELHLDATYVALEARLGGPVAAGPVNPAVTTREVDSRRIGRLLKHPSGERPREIAQVTIGGGFQGATSGPVPSAVVDEVAFGTTEFGMASPPIVDVEGLRGASMILDRDVSDTDNVLRVIPRTIRTSRERFNAVYDFLREFPDTGLLRVGEELVAYQRRDPTTGEIAVAENGRGALGTTAQAHQMGENVAWLEPFRVGILSGGVGAGNSLLPLTDTKNFPDDGTVLVGGELVHYTRLRGGGLEMPRASSVAGAMDQEGAPLFRARFGTQAGAHAVGEAVYLFPFRYWDRWADRADAPELAYFGLAADQPSAFWSACFFTKMDKTASTVEVLARLDPAAPWDADPDKDPRLVLLTGGEMGGKPKPLGIASDRIEWRVYTRYMQGAFDYSTGLSHGWKETPRLERLGATYFAPGIVLSSVER